MKNPRKVYHDENYHDLPPVGTCCLCGEPIEAGDPYYETDDGPIHAKGVYRRVRIDNVTHDVTCLAAYLTQKYFDDDLAAALGIRKVGA